MPHKGPHISISADKLVERVLGLSPEAFNAWPEAVRLLGLQLCEELFLVRYNPFIDPKVVFASVQTVFSHARPSLSKEYVAVLEKSIHLIAGKTQVCGAQLGQLPACAQT